MQELDEIIASGKAEVEALKALVSDLEKQIKEIHQEGKAQMEQLEARAAVLNRQIERAASKRSVRHISILHTQLEKAHADVKDLHQQTWAFSASTSALPDAMISSSFF
jgi:hypothetical protein